MSTAYILKSRKHPKVDAEYDAYCLPQDRKDMLDINMIGIREFEMPKQVFFMADFLAVPKHDLIKTDVSFPVMSAKMLESILEMGDFKYHSIPAIMIDDSFLEDPFSKSGALKPNVPHIGDYFAIQLKEYCDVFDYENSEYQKSTVISGKIRFIHKLILKEPQKGFPPIFKIKEKKGALFINSVTKNQLENSGIQGCVFESVETT